MRTVRLIPAALAAALSLLPFAAFAHEADVRGELLALLPAAGEAVVRVDLPGVGSRAETVRVLPARRLAALAVGDRIAGVIDSDETPWTLASVQVTGKSSLTGNAAAVPAPIVPVVRAVETLRAGDALPTPAFLDQRGAPFSLSDLRGQTVVLAFIYTRCTDIRECPLISGKFAALQARFRGQPVHLVEVSLDPAYDRPAVLARYGRKFGADPARWTLATGDPQKILAFAAQFDVTAFPDPRLGVIHTERTVLVSPAGLIDDMVEDVAWTPSDIVAEVDHDRGLASNPLERLNLWLSSAAIAMCGNSVQSFSGFTDLLIVLGIVATAVFAGWRMVRLLSRSAT